MKKIRLIASTIASVGAAGTVVVVVFNWAKTQNISWMTLFVTLFIVLVVLLVSYFAFIEPVNRNGKNIESKMDGYFRNMNRTIQDIYNAVREIQNSNPSSICLHPLSPKSMSEWAEAGSPLKLSGAGEKLREGSRIDLIVSENSEKLIAILEKQKLDTALDVQERSFTVLADFILSDPVLSKKVKNFVFNNPKVGNRNIGFPDVIFVGSILLRDRYLDKHKELKENQ